MSDLESMNESAFPMHALPPILRDFAEAGSRSLPTPPEMIAIPCLVVAGAAIGNSCVIELKENWRESASIYAAIISPSGTMKSPALSYALQSLQELEEQTQRRTWTSNVTVESFIRLLAENPRGLLVACDELTAWVRSMNQYKQGKGSDRQFYLSSWNGAPFAYDRVTESTHIRIPRPFVSVVGCIPPEMVGVLNDEKGSEDGFTARILPCWPKMTPVRWNERVITPETRDAYLKLIKELYGIPYDPENLRVLKLSSETRTVWVQWHDTHCAEMEQPGLHPFLRGAYAKLKGYCARLSLIHALATDPTAVEISPQSMEAGIQLTEYFRSQFVGVSHLFVQHPGGQIERCVKEITRKVTGSPGGKIRDYQRRSAFDAPTFHTALDRLLNATLRLDADGRLWPTGPTNRPPTEAA